MGKFRGLTRKLKKLKASVTGHLVVDGERTIVTEKISSGIKSDIRSLEISEGVETIRYRAFEDCIQMSTIIFPQDSLITIEDYAFVHCERLKKLSLPDSLTRIGAFSFSGCKRLKQVDLPMGLSIIGPSAFRLCDGLQKVDLPSGLQTIYPSAFSYCGNLSQVSCPSGLRVLPVSCFAYCANLQEISLPEDLFDIQRHAFVGCSRLTTIDLPHKLINIYDYAFSGCGVEDIHFPDSLIQIGAYAFCGCEGLESIKFGRNLSIIGYSAFSHCDKLTSVELPASLYFLSARAFEFCEQLQFVSIPNSVTSYGVDVFRGCRNLQLVVIPDNFDHGVIVDSLPVIGHRPTVLKQSAFSAWKLDYSIENKNYTFADYAELYRINQDQNYIPSWDNMVVNHPNIGAGDFMKLLPPEKREALFSNPILFDNTQSDPRFSSHLFDLSFHGHILPGINDYMTIKDYVNLKKTAKDLSVKPVKVQSVNAKQDDVAEQIKVKQSNIKPSYLPVKARPLSSDSPRTPNNRTNRHS